MTIIYSNPIVKIIEASHREYGRQGPGRWIDDLDMWIVLFDDGKKPCAALCLVTDIEVLYTGLKTPGKEDVWQN